MSETKKKSRQQAWAEKKRLEGYCMICGQPRVEWSACYCKKHRDAHRKQYHDKKDAVV